MKERGLGTGALVAIIVGVVVAIVVSVTIAAVLLTGGGEGGTGESIIGTWQGSHLGATETFTFNTNGTYDWSSDGSQQSGNWGMSGDILYLDGYPFKVMFGNNTMDWYEQDPDTGAWDVLSRSFTRVA